MKVSILILEHGKGLPIPCYATSGSSGVDLRAAISETEEIIIPPYETRLIPCGVCFSIPRGYEGQVRSRSGLSLKNGIIVLNSPGTIDSDYRGEIKLILMNTSKTPFKVERGARLAQLVITPVQQVEFVQVEVLDDSIRAENGFGSTGVL